MEKKNTIISISERTGFSVSTVSRVLNGKAEIARISKSTVEAIEQEAKRCNYKPSLLAKGLRTNKTNTIGLVIPSMENIYFANLASTIIRDARSYGYTIVTVDTMENERNERDGEDRADKDYDQGEIHGSPTAPSPRGASRAARGQNRSRRPSRARGSRRTEGRRSQ